jgi:hypothetical protein
VGNFRFGGSVGRRGCVVVDCCLVCVGYRTVRLFHQGWLAAWLAAWLGGCLGRLCDIMQEREVGSLEQRVGHVTARGRRRWVGDDWMAPAALASGVGGEVKCGLDGTGPPGPIWASAGYFGSTRALE